MTESFLIGKARSLPDALAVMRKALDALGISLVEEKWLNPAPHIWSVHVKAENCPILFANGKGISREAALASAMGEFLERWMSGYFFADYALPPDLPWYFTPDERRMPAEAMWNALPEALRRLYEQWEPVAAERLSCLARCDEREIIGLPLQNAAGETVTLPWNLLTNLYASNGLAAGSTPLEARVQALSEILERWVRQRIIVENRTLPPVDETALATFPRIRAARAALARQGIELDIRDASLGEGWPVVAIILWAVRQGRAFVSFGAHPVMEVAVERTLTEAFQGRALGQWSGYRSPAHDMDWVQDEANLEAHFVDASGQFHWSFFERREPVSPRWGLSSDSSLEAQWRYLAEGVQRAGYAIYGADYALAGFHACRLVVPGLSEVFSLASWAEADHSRGCRLRQHLIHSQNAPNASWLERLLEILDDMGVDDQTPICDLVGAKVSENNPWHWVRAGELRLWALLSLNEISPEAACDMSRMLAETLPPEAPLQGAHQATIWSLAGVSEDAWRSRQAALRRLYGESGVAWAQVAWRRNWWARLPLGPALLEDPLHQSLWRVLRDTRMP